MKAREGRQALTAGESPHEENSRVPAASARQALGAAVQAGAGKAIGSDAMQVLCQASGRAAQEQLHE